MERTIYVVDRKVRNAFIKVKRDVFELKSYVESQQTAIQTLANNQKELLLRIRKLESAPVVRNVERKVEQRIIVKKVTAKKTYVGAKTSMRVHSLNCPFAKNIKVKNKVLFKSRSKALGKGFSACDCLKR